MSAIFYNEKDIKLHDNTEDYDSSFKYTLEVGKTEDNSPIYVDMLGYVNDSGEMSDFKINTWCYDTDEGIVGYVNVKNGNTKFIDIPQSVQNTIFALTKEAVKTTESEKIKEYCEWYADGAEDITEDAEGLICFNGLGEFNGFSLYADYHALIVEDNSILPNHDKGKYYLSPIYNMDSDKAYIIVPNEEFTGRKILIDMPHDILEKCEKQAEDMAYRIKCEELHERLYKEYEKGYIDGFDLGSDMRLIDDIDEETDPVAHCAMEYAEWLSVAYPDEGYFSGHVFAEDAKFLCEHDELINLDYYELYEKTITTCLHLTAEDFIVKKGGDVSCYEISDPSIFEADMDKFISRSNRPILVKEIGSRFRIKADSYSNLCENDNIDICSNISFTVKNDQITASVNITVNGNDIERLNNIPLSYKEQAFVHKAIEEIKGNAPKKSRNEYDDKE